MKNIIIFGNGMLGNCVYKFFVELLQYNVIQIIRSDFDVLKNTRNDLMKLLNKSSFDVVINTIGLIPHSGNTNKNDYFKINSDFPKMLESLLPKHCKMIHITTDCVFDGEKGNYNEDSKKTEMNDYGKSKADGENLKNATIIRTSIIGEQENNYIKPSLLEWIRTNENGNIEGYSDIYWNGITCLKMAEIIHTIIDHNLFFNGPRHFYSSTVSKYELLQIINQVYQLNTTIIKKETKNPSNKCLSSTHNTLSLFDIEPIEILIQQQKDFEIDN